MFKRFSEKVVTCAETRSKVPLDVQETPEKKPAGSEATVKILPQGVVESLTAEWDLQPPPNHADGQGQA